MSARGRARRVIYRELSGPDLRVSVLGLDLDPSASGNPGPASRGTTLLARALDAGLTVYAVSDTGIHWLAELRQALEPRPTDTRPVVVLQLTRDEDRQGEDDPTAVELERWRAACRRLRVHSGGRWDSVLLLTVPSGENRPSAAAVAVAEELRELADARAWGPKWGRIPRDAHGASDLLLDQSMWGVSLNLLEREASERAGAMLDGGPARAFAFDPFASGRLDGSWLERGPRVAPDARGPMDVQELRDRYAPVLRLGFLTANRRRTLAQAAVQYVLTYPGVAAVLVPAPDGAPLADLARPEEIPPLDVEELGQIGTG